MPWPTGPVETRAHEVDDDGSGTVGTIVEAADLNWVYDLLARIEIKVGPDSDPAATPSVEGRLKALEALDPLTDPLTTAGDLLLRNASNVTDRLGIGTAGQVLTVVGGLPAWAPGAAGALIDPTTTPGDLIYRDGTNVTARLGIGLAGQVLGISNGLPAWLTPDYIADPHGAPVGAVLLKDATATWSYLAPGTTGFVLTANGSGAVPAWAAVPSTPPGSGIIAPTGLRVGALIQYNGSDFQTLVPGSAGQVLTAHGDDNVTGSLLTWAAPPTGMTNPMTTLADLIVAGTGGAPGRLGIGAAGQVLTVVAGAPAWAAPTGGGGGFADPMTTAYDLIYRNGSNVTARLGKGLDGQVLSVDPADHAVKWMASASGFADPMTTRGDLIVRGASGTTRLGLGPSGQVLQSNGTDALWGVSPQPGHVIWDEGTPLPARAALNFVGPLVTVTDDSGANASVVTLIPDQQTALWYGGY